MDKIHMSAEIDRRRFLASAGMTTVTAQFGTSANKSHTALADQGPLPDLGGAIGWLNSVPLT